MSLFSKTLLTRGSVDPNITSLIGKWISSEDARAKHYFHKIMVYNWDCNDIQLYERLIDYFSVSFVPVSYSSTKSSVLTFYTSSLPLVLKIISLGFVFPYDKKKQLINIEVLLNDKTSLELFNSETTLEDIITGVVSNRFKPNYELDLSNFYNDEKFLMHKIHFYKLSLLASFKLLMLRMGRDCKILNLSHNQLTEMPQEITNFFIKGELTELNLSHNNIPSLSSLQRINSKIEKLWIEGNKFCANMKEHEYIREIMKKFPRLIELDGIQVNNYGVNFPFYKNFILNNEGDSQNIVDEFVKLYFAHYDCRMNRNVKSFYDRNAVFTLSSNLNDIEKASMPKISMYSRNLNKPNKEYNKVYCGADAVYSVLRALPMGSHDLTTFRVDIIYDFDNMIVFVIDGLFKEDVSDKYFSFRRTFILKCIDSMDHRKCFIINEMFTISLAYKDLKETFQGPTRHIGELTLVKPTEEEQRCMLKILKHVTHLKDSEADSRLKNHSWDLRECLIQLKSEIEMKMIDDDVFSSDDEMQNMIYEID